MRTFFFKPNFGPSKFIKLSKLKKSYTSYYKGEYCKINFQFNDKIDEMCEDLGWCKRDFTNCFAVYEVLAFFPHGYHSVMGAWIAPV